MTVVCASLAVIGATRAVGTRITVIYKMSYRTHAMAGARPVGAFIFERRRWPGVLMGL
jgi:hypothetical protein